MLAKKLTRLAAYALLCFTAIISLLIPLSPIISTILLSTYLLINLLASQKERKKTSIATKTAMLILLPLNFIFLSSSLGLIAPYITPTICLFMIFLQQLKQSPQPIKTNLTPNNGTIIIHLATSDWRCASCTPGIEHFLNQQQTQISFEYTTCLDTKAINIKKCQDNAQLFKSIQQKYSTAQLQNTLILESTTKFTNEDIVTIKAIKTGILIKEVKIINNQLVINYANINNIPQLSINSHLQKKLNAKKTSVYQPKSKTTINHFLLCTVCCIALYLICHLAVMNFQLQLLLAVFTANIAIITGNNIFTKAHSQLKILTTPITLIVFGIILINGSAPLASLYLAALAFIIIAKYYFINLANNKALLYLTIILTAILLLKTKTIHLPLIGMTIIVIASLYIIKLAAENKMDMYISQTLSIGIFFCAQLASLWAPILPMAHWHHVLLMLSILLISYYFKNQINTLKTTTNQPKSSQLMAMPVKINKDSKGVFVNKLQHGDTFTLLEQNALAINATADEKNDCFLTNQSNDELNFIKTVLPAAICTPQKGSLWIDEKTLTGQHSNRLVPVTKNLPKGVPVYFKQNSSPELKCDKTTCFHSQQKTSSNLYKSIEWINKYFTSITFTATLFAIVQAYFSQISIVANICSTLVIACPCIFMVIDNAITYVAMQMLANKVNFNSQNLLKILSGLNQSATISFDKTGTLTKSRTSQSNAYPQILPGTNTLLEKISAKFTKIEIISGASKKELKELQLDDKKIEKISIADKSKREHKADIHVGDSWNDFKACKDGGIFISLPQSIDAVAQNSHLQLTRKNDYFADLIYLLDAAEWITNMHFYSYTIAIIYSLSIIIYTAYGGVASPMLACLLLCIASVASLAIILTCGSLIQHKLETEYKNNSPKLSTTLQPPEPPSQSNMPSGSNDSTNDSAAQLSNS